MSVFQGIIGNKKITNTKYPYYLGLSVFFILMIIAHIVISNMTLSKLDADGCMLDEKGVRLRKRVSGSSIRGTVVYRECSKPKSTFFKYSTAVFISAVFGALSGVVISIYN